MILVFGGTTEGKQVAKTLDELGKQYTYSTKTPVRFEGKGIAISGAMQAQEIEEFCVENKVSHIINAAHPFAVNLHRTIAALRIEIPLIRFERAFPKRKEHPLITYVSDFEIAITHFEVNSYQSLLALSGVQTIMKLKSYWEKNQTWFRILDREVSRTIAANAGFPKEQLLYGLPQLAEKEIELIEKLQPEVMLTKESGTNGKLEEKIKAALQTQTPLVIIKRPEISKRYLCIQTIPQLIEVLN